MKYALVLALCAVVALAAPQNRNQDIQVVSEQRDNDGSGNYRSNFALTDGTNREETGEFRALGEELGIQKVTGVISWTSPEGQLITLRYVADENGYRPVGDHLPK